MSSTISLKPTHLILSSFSTGKVLQFRRSRFSHTPSSSSSRYRTLVAQLGFRPDSFDFIKDHAENLLYTIADAAVSSSETFESVAGTTTKTTQSNDWFSGIANYMETILKVESAMAMKSLTPQIKAIQERYAGDQEKIQLETARLYKLAGINPLAGCLPTLATIPVWIGLYRALSNVADEGLLTEGFFWIPSLAGPTTVAARQNGSGISWLFPFIEGHPPLGWPDTLAYLVLPLLLVFSQYLSIQIMQSSQSNDPAMKSSQAVTKLLPLMIGYFALSVPSGLSLYWLTNNILSTAQQVWLQKYGGAKNPVEKFTNLVTKEDKTQQIEKSFSEPLVQKSVSELKIPREKGGEKVTPECPKPGERFRLLKEQEAKRRREKEERQKAEAALSNQNTDKAHEQDEKSDTAIVAEDDKKTELSAVDETSDGTVAVNGKPSIQKDETTNGTFGIGHDTEQQHSHETEKR
ncbi:OxaA/YidC-like membrane insertion protein [Arabidopsis thaliana]|uniref:OxaA/YidC-like membrane insertion protein n=1 Tax=Arabidopsis thaliana TaxID=3702 RepID=F4I9A9_ARATH|nr:OxaA/YidC-like membrane insertion protein [Arabidopsis thaliana]AEE30540.1 OxaA/YidC-like membrane insertion protein [Arabidopsis thaliana]|eukprot:NP_001154364.1 OxaA/YidC-like membrane insertion protein [Arabidopsis thaliana]